MLYEWRETKRCCMKQEEPEEMLYEGESIEEPEEMLYEERNQRRCYMKERNQRRCCMKQRGTRGDAV
ncbi:Threonine synthase-like 2 [Dissostichus eleginoides]|uniref:Threonine synthase-like 2 n=1 Tax=Dissostichus eleginoides TaxID=100907 RepID=A0AAD9B292_DISEL|nr:Threonine synthase-like 2 [Dissostichus eleginoides]